MYYDELELEKEVVRLERLRHELRLLYGPGTAPAGSMTRTEIAEMRDEALAAGHYRMAELITRHLVGRVEMETAAL